MATGSVAIKAPKELHGVQPSLRFLVYMSTPNISFHGAEENHVKTATVHKR